MNKSLAALAKNTALAAYEDFLSRWPSDPRRGVKGGTPRPPQCVKATERVRNV